VRRRSILSPCSQDIAFHAAYASPAAFRPLRAPPAAARRASPSSTAHTLRRYRRASCGRRGKRHLPGNLSHLAFASRNLTGSDLVRRYLDAKVARPPPRVDLRTRITARLCGSRAPLPYLDEIVRSARRTHRPAHPSVITYHRAPSSADLQMARYGSATPYFLPPPKL